jgi:hypothetical protein
MLVCEGPVPPIAVYERHDSIKLVISTFNLSYEVIEAPNAFSLRLTPNPAKAEGAAVFRTLFHDSGAKQEVTTLEVLICGSIILDKIEIEESKARVKVLLPKFSGRVVINRVRAD